MGAGFKKGKITEQRQLTARINMMSGLQSKRSRQSRAVYAMVNGDGATARRYAV